MVADLNRWLFYCWMEKILKLRIKNFVKGNYLRAPNLIIREKDIQFNTRLIPKHVLYINNK